MPPSLLTCVFAFVCTVQEHMALRVKRVEWDLEARTMERVSGHLNKGMRFRR